MNDNSTDLCLNYKPGFELTVVSLIVQSVLCVVTNLVLLLALRKDRIVVLSGAHYFVSHTCNVDTMLKILATIGIINCCSQVCFQLISFSYGKWVFGQHICQLQAFFTRLMNFSNIWSVALLGFERYTHHLKPQEYSLTLSKLNLKVILNGIFFILLIAVSGPLYGWGEYSFIKPIGLCGLDLTSKNIATQLLFSFTIYVFLPSFATCSWLVMVMVKSEPVVSLITEKSFTNRSSIYTLSLGSFIFLLLETPAYIGSIVQYYGLKLDSNVIFYLYWIQMFGLNTSFTLCCLFGCSHLRFFLSKKLICRMKNRCVHLHIPSELPG